ncbi:putative glucan 1,3-alpha-glucosidase [Gracilariopsis chorda]|uniref:Putative glucan 1,3-alpha-glucosidase n=1 Tax=Gracilariopsis chorda TaxID=448386 RepID=A0A2V3INX4_9FLOR|nr:putative glucan 1,3-alpha-glucosidase [Gracilariopsis chorda]|eukprot:PXF43785.1 putative glucan 1,3-alpha-glucosidase [Gracilariopsis chorda]
MGPPMRPLWWHFPNDSVADSNQRQWMVGDALLVAPVLEDDVSSHRVYIPHGETWYDLYHPKANGKKVTDSGDVEQQVTLDRMFVFQRGGTIVPKQERRRRSTAAMAHDPFTLVVALNASKEAEGELYLDDGKTFQYKSGAYAVRRFTFENSELSAQTVSGGATAFDGSEAEIERIIILGYEGDTPKEVVTDSRVINFVYSRTSGALTVQNPRVKAAAGTWKITIR